MTFIKLDSSELKQQAEEFSAKITNAQKSFVSVVDLKM